VPNQGEDASRLTNRDTPWARQSGPTSGRRLRGGPGDSEDAGPTTW